MNLKSIELAVDSDLRLSSDAMQRAARRARQLARATNTSVVVCVDGKLEVLHPDDARLSPVAALTE